MTDTSTITESIGEEINLFMRHIDSLHETLPMTMFVIQEAGKKFSETLEDFEKENCSVTINEEEKRVTIPIEHVRRWSKLSSRHDKSQLAQTLIPRSIMVALVSQYDAFVGRLLRAIFLAKPELLNASEKSLSFAEVAAFPSIENIRDYVIEKEIEGVLRSSHAEQIKWMENRFGLPLTKGLTIWPKFIELTERRNLFVHTDGVVSSQYLSVCRQHGVTVEPGVEEGSRLGVPQKYFNECYACTFELGVKLAHVLWRKLLPDDREAADKNLVHVTYDLIDRDECHLALALLDLACDTFKTYENEWFELAFIINRAQAFKWSGNDGECLRVLSAVDWSAKGNEFKLADAVLREDWPKALEIMKHIGTNGPISKLNYRDWPLFRKFRDHQDFLATYEVIFSEPFPRSVTAEPTYSDKNVKS